MPVFTSGAVAAGYWNPTVASGPSRRSPRWIASRSRVVLCVVKAHAYAMSCSRTPGGSRPSTGASSPLCAGWLMPEPGGTTARPCASRTRSVRMTA